MLAILTSFFLFLNFASVSGSSDHPSAEHGDESIGDVILHHISDDHVLDFTPFGKIELPHIELLGIDFSITKHVVMMILAAFLLIFLMKAAARHQSGEPSSRFSSAIEALVEFIRNEIAVANMGTHLGVSLTPYLCTLFFFILTCNILGLVPYGAAATSNISVTATLAALTFILTQAMAIKANGVGGYLKHLTGGVHPMMWVVMVPVEFLGLFTKPFALCIRLFANMTAGHVIILSLINLIFIFGKSGENPIAGYGVAPLTIAFSLFVNLLEIFVSFLQAYIFTLLTALFVGFAAHSEHHEDEAHPV